MINLLAFSAGSPVSLPSFSPLISSMIFIAGKTLELEVQRPVLKNKDRASIPVNSILHEYHQCEQFL